MRRSNSGDIIQLILSRLVHYGYRLNDSLNYISKEQALTKYLLSYLPLDTLIIGGVIH